MSKLASKLSKRIMATVLSVAMVMSNMTVYASELSGPQVEADVEESVADVEDTSVTTDDAVTSGDESVVDEVVADAADDASDETVGDEVVGDTADDAADDDIQTPEAGGDEDSDSKADEAVGSEDKSLENVEEVNNDEGSDNGKVYVLESKPLETFTNSSSKIEKKSEQAGTDDYFTIIYGEKSKVDNTSDKTWGDGYTSVVSKDENGKPTSIGSRINFGAKIDTSNFDYSIKFTTESAANVKVWWAANGDNNDREMVIYKSDGSKEDETALSTAISVDSGTSSAIVKNSPYISTLRVSGAGEYYLGSINGGNFIFKVEVTEGDAAKLARPALGDDKIPTINVAYPVDEETETEDKSKLVVTVGADLSDEGGDLLQVTMTDEEGTVESQYDASSKAEYDFTFAPKASGKYSFKAILSRIGEAGQKESTVEEVDFVYGIPVPQGLEVKSAGGTITAKWNKVADAVGYKVKVVAADVPNTTVINEKVTETTFTSEVDELTVGTKYLVSVAAIVEIDGEETDGEYSPTEEVTVSADAGQENDDLIDINLSNGLSKNATYANGDLVVLDDMPSKSTGENAVEISGTSYTTYVAGSVNPSPNKGLVPTVGAVVKFTASKPGRIYFAVNTNKEAHFLDANDVDENGKCKDYIGGATIVDKRIQFDVIEGHTYYLYGDGTKIKLYAIRIDYREAVKSAWDTDTIPLPEVTSAVADDEGTITVKAKGLVGITESEPVTAYADTLRVDMYDEEGELVASVDNSSTNANRDNLTEQTFVFTPTASGDYTFKPALVRSGVEDIVGNAFEGVHFILPLKGPVISSITDKGIDKETNSPKVEVALGAVDEATGYLVKVTEKPDSDDEDDEADAAAVADSTDSNSRTYRFDGDTPILMIKDGLEVGKTYTFAVAAVRIRKDTGTGEDVEDVVWSENTKDHLVTNENNVTWAFTYYGQSTKATNNKYVSIFDDDETRNKTVSTSDGTVLTLDEDAGDQVRVRSSSNSGKIQPTSHDGLAFYFTTIDPKTTNFVLSATVEVNEWTYSNGQDGFGVMVSDRVVLDTDDDADALVWNNSYQAVVSKLDYRWDSENNQPVYDGDTDKPRYEMKIGIGSTEKKGVTKANLSEFLVNQGEASSTYFKADTKTLETSLGQAGIKGGTYNIIGNYAGGTPDGTMEKYLLTKMKLSVELNNTGYFVSYTPIDQKTEKPIGETCTVKYYDRDALSHIDEDYVYAGFFAARNADITLRNISFTTSDPATDPPAEEQPDEYVVPSYGISSGTVANHSPYDMLFTANWPGWLTIKDSKNKVLANNVKINPDRYGVIPTMKIENVELSVGNNTFQWTYTPDETYNPEAPAYYVDNGYSGKGYDGDKQHLFLQDYESQTGSFMVVYKEYGDEGEAIYVSPTGSALGTGTKANPLDIYTAVKYAQAGQTIYLMPGKNNGVYSLARTITIDRGISGSEGKPIKMMPAPNNKGIVEARSIVFDFGRHCEGMVIAGDYWYMYGFDVTKTAYGNNGIRVCGSHNTLDSVYTYNNGNTGIGIGRYKSDSKEFWPKYNLILNCTSYLNADQGFEDADGFAAKLTIGEGNVFDGCIAAYNADDGWDLYSKSETGSIGSVIIRNSIAYKNGYVRVVDPNKDGKITFAEATSTSRVLDLKKGIEIPAGNGNGFKMGGSSLASDPFPESPEYPGAIKGAIDLEYPSSDVAGHHLISSLAFRNKKKGVDSNSGPNIKVKNTVSYNNESWNYAFYHSSSAQTDFASEGAISYRSDDKLDLWGTASGTGDSVVKSSTTYNKAVKEESMKDISYILDIDLDKKSEKTDPDLYGDLTATTLLEVGGKRTEMGTNKYYTIYFNDDADNPSSINVDAKDKIKDFSALGDKAYKPVHSLVTGGTARLVDGDADAEIAAVAAVKFETLTEASVKIYWSSDVPDAKLVILDSKGNKVFEADKATDTENPKAGMISKTSLSGAGTYFIGGSDSIRLYKADVTTWPRVKDMALLEDERLIFAGAQNTDGTAVINSTNYFWNTATTTSRNTLGATVSADWFKNIDFLSFEEEMIKDIVNYPRNPDGSINTHGFMELTDKAGVDGSAGDYFGGSESRDPNKDVIPPTTSGNVSGGDAAGEADAGVRPADMDKYTEIVEGTEAGKEIGLWFNIVNADEIYYTGKAIKPEVHVYEGTTLLSKKDYTVTYKNNINACIVDTKYPHYKDYTSVPDNKKPTIIVRGKGNYVSREIQPQYFNIRPVELSDDLYVAARDIGVAAGKTSYKISPVVTFNGKKLSTKKDYNFGLKPESGSASLSDKLSLTEADNGKTIVISAIAGGNFAGSKEIKFRVIAKENLVSTFKIAKIADQIREGYEDYEETIPKRIEPVLSVTKKDGGALTLAYTDDKGELKGDYTVTYVNNVEVGIATAIVTGINDYAGTKEVRFRIIAPKINTLMSGRTPTLRIDVPGSKEREEVDFRSLSYQFTGKAITIKGLGVSRYMTTIDADGKETTAWVPLELDKDYTITYRNNTRAGSASVLIKGKGNYGGTVSKSFKIQPFDLNSPGDVTIGGTFAESYDMKIENPVSYEKGGAKPEVVLLVGGQKMLKGKDYTVSYRYNTQANAYIGADGKLVSAGSTKTPQIIIRGKGGLKGTLTKEFTIVRKSLADPDVTITADDVTVSRKSGDGYTGNLAPRIIIKDANGKVLSASTDYDKTSITYEIVPGSGSGSIAGGGTIDSKGEVDTSKTKPTVTLNVKDGKVEPLTIKATVKVYDTSDAKKFDKCNYADVKTVEFRVGYAKQSIRSARVVVNYGKETVNGREKKKTYFDYTAQPIRLNQSGATKDLTVTVGGVELEYNKDFVIVTKPVDSYVNNVNRGTASLTIRGIGEYTGTKIVKFRIGAKLWSWHNFTPSPSKEDYDDTDTGSGDETTDETDEGDDGGEENGGEENGGEENGGGEGNGGNGEAGGADSSGSIESVAAVSGALVL